MNKLNPSQSILKNYLKEPVRIEDINLFRDSLKRLLNEINEDETEEFNKNLVIHFLRYSLYSDRHFLVNTYGRTDLAIYVDAATQEEHPVVLFEVKGPSRPDMVSHDNMNKKAMHELVLYYLIEEVEKKNNDIKHLIITDCRQFFIFEKKNSLDCLRLCRHVANTNQSDRQYASDSKRWCPSRRLDSGYIVVLPSQYALQSRHCQHILPRRRSGGGGQRH